MIVLFQERNPFLVPILAIVALALKWGFISQPIVENGMVAGGLIGQWLQNEQTQSIPHALGSAIAIIILFLAGLLFNYQLTGKRMYPKSHLLTALSFVALTSIFAGVQYLHPGMIMLFFTLNLFRLSTRLYQSGSPKTLISNMGLLVGAGVLLYHPFWWMVPYALLAIAIMRPFKMNEWVLFLVSLFIPAYLLLSYQYLTNQWNPLSNLPDWKLTLAWPVVNRWWVVAAVMVTIWLLLGFAAWQKSNQRMLIETRKNWTLLLLLGIFSLPPLFFSDGNYAEALTLLLLPVSAFCTYAFLPAKRGWRHTAWFWILVALAATNSWAVLHNLM